MSKMRLISGRPNDSELYEVSDPDALEFIRSLKTQMRTGKTTAFNAVVKGMKGEGNAEPFASVTKVLKGYKVSKVTQELDILRITLKPCSKGRPRKYAA